MNNSNDFSTLDHRPLADNELDAVTGGFNLLGGILPGPSAPPSPRAGINKMSDIELKRP